MLEDYSRKSRASSDLRWEKVFSQRDGERGTHGNTWVSNGVVGILSVYYHAS